MRATKVLALLLLGLLPPLISPIFADDAASSGTELILEEVATSDRQWTGIAVSKTGRVFVNYPRWGFTLPFSVGELQEDGTVLPYPDENWNLWGSGDDATRRFVCVQALWVDEEDRLWILDPANPLFMGVVEGGPKLVCIELATNRVLRSIPFDPSVTPRDSYLNDVRFDLDKKFAYISESGLGSIVVLDLRSGIARRRLADHPSTKSEGITLQIEGKPWEMPGGVVPQVHSDGIALSPDREWIYYQALSGRTMYRVPTTALRDFELSEAELGTQVESVAEVGASDGILFAANGDLYLSSLEHNAIRSLRSDGSIEVVTQGALLRWPDSFSWGPEGSLYLTTALIHLGPAPEDLYRIFRIPGLNPPATKGVVTEKEMR